MEIAGEIGIFENQKACGPLRKRLFGAKRYAQWWFVGAMLTGDILVSTLMDMAVPGYGWFAMMLFTAVALFFWIRYARTLGSQGLDGAWRAGGFADHLQDRGGGSCSGQPDVDDPRRMVWHVADRARS